jgi:hypothetical protein
VSNTTMTARPTNGENATALTPARASVSRISSGAYATEDRASEAKIGKAMRLGSSVWDSRSFRKGRPTSTRFAAFKIVSTPQSYSEYPAMS